MRSSPSTSFRPVFSKPPDCGSVVHFASAIYTHPILGGLIIGTLESRFRSYTVRAVVFDGGRAPEATLRSRQLSRGAALPSVEVSGGAAVVGFLGVGVSLVLFVLALRHLGAARTGAYFSLAPFIGALVAIVLLHDPLSVRLVLSGALMGFGLWMHLAERHEHEHEHDALEHE